MVVICSPTHYQLDHEGAWVQLVKQCTVDLQADGSDSYVAYVWDFSSIKRRLTSLRDSPMAIYLR